jgi:hypothetical protein
MKKILLSIITIALLFLLIGCSKANQNDYTYISSDNIQDNIESNIANNLKTLKSFSLPLSQASKKIKVWETGNALNGNKYYTADILKISLDLPEYTYVPLFINGTLRLYFQNDTHTELFYSVPINNTSVTVSQVFGSTYASQKNTNTTAVSIDIKAKIDSNTLILDCHKILAFDTNAENIIIQPTKLYYDASSVTLLILE